MTKSSVPDRNKIMLAVASSALCDTQTSTEMVFCQLHYYAVSLLYLLWLSQNMQLT